ncbi:YbhB/YbcL family Raf kinase inhibitor-like protein [Legionella bononiensis]|uniref:YbhB/YbcL family Raf kinase inhibitor-like protein n=1 Tax=Legionella bononiensis TaxID=2793102 RepID=A0ABS1W6X9_9GAMM|nr:YbhB/YbcL family Raf kinase inhibitor-like protein [Legionella bononiensis]MBL7525122.1 YbhB/YbcL family Raf kinase inhibitor-like protein [Legionella bononiensis]MBL7562847.1 YbhB/YbcL family Raf kinase inhibitor-like protein [Legionella bononiensis]
MKKVSLLLFLFLGLIQVTSYAAEFTLESSAFTPNSMIPNEYTCSGVDTSPPLSWQNIPPNTQSLALVISDPDAPGGEWIHWIIFNIPPTVTKLDAASPLPDGASNGTNSWGTTNYKGPCPPIGAHRYVFTLYALDNLLNLENGASKDDVLNAMTGHVIGNAELIGLYQKL